MRPSACHIGQLVRVSSGPTPRNGPIIHRGGQTGRILAVWRKDKLARVKVPGLDPFVVPTSRLKPEEDT